MGIPHNGRLLGGAHFQNLQQLRKRYLDAISFQKTFVLVKGHFGKLHIQVRIATPVSKAGARWRGTLPSSMWHFGLYLIRFVRGAQINSRFVPPLQV